MTSLKHLLSPIAENVATSDAPATFAEKIPAAALPILERLTESLEDVKNQIFDFVPSLILALIIVIIGMFIAKIISWVVKTIFSKLGLDDLLSKAGLTDILGKFGMSGSPGATIAKLLYFALMLGVVKTGVEILGIEALSAVLEKIIVFLPKIITASIILLVGFLVAEIAKSAVAKSLEAVGLDYAKTLSGILYGFICIIVTTVALSQLGIETELLNAAVKILLISLALAIGLALGLGLKAHAGNIVAGVYARDLYQIGTAIEHGGELAKVSGVGPLTTKLQKQDGTFVMIPNDHLILKEVSGRSAE